MITIYDIFQFHAEHNDSIVQTKEVKLVITTSIDTYLQVKTYVFNEATSTPQTHYNTYTFDEYYNIQQNLINNNKVIKLEKERLRK